MWEKTGRRFFFPDCVHKFIFFVIHRLLFMLYMLNTPTFASPLYDREKLEDFVGKAERTKKKNTAHTKHKHKHNSYIDIFFGHLVGWIYAIHNARQFLK